MLISLLKTYVGKLNLFDGIDNSSYQLFDIAASMGGFFMSMDIA
jgi:hypothetical protein